ncbi:MAG: hypothetical protein JW715_07820 [Sedimentisphaerales bacterium]|nr:hypothetical protein [Sedimentisphaerales bacterium]
MKTLIQLIGYISIIVLIVPSMLYLAGKMELNQVKTTMLIATIVWFAANTILAWHLEDKIMGKNK